MQHDETRAAVTARLRAAGCVYAEDETELLLEAAAGDNEKLETLTRQRETGTSLEHLLGWAEFDGLRIEVDAGVFVPRTRTTLLVKEAAQLLHPGRIVVDLCCGSGAIAASLAERVPGLELYAADIDPAAVAVARRNVEPRGGHVFEGDLFDALPAALKGEIDVLVVNAPYVPSDEIANMPREARENEPNVTLDGGSDGMEVQRRVVVGATEWLKPGGTLIIETSIHQSGTLQKIFAEAGFAARTLIDDDLDATVVRGRK